MSEKTVHTIEDIKPEIEELRNFLSQEDYAPNKVTDRELFLLHHSCYYKIDKTKECMKVYYSLRTKTPDFFADRNVDRPNLKAALDALHYGAFPVKDRNGYQIVFHRLRNHDPPKYVFVDGVKLLMMTMDACNHIEGALPGYIILFDMAGVKLGHLTRLSLYFLKKFFQYVQEGLPIRLKAIHVVNVLPILDKVMILIKPFMKKELYSILHFHRTPNGKYDSLYEHLPPDCLPSDFGGELESVETLHAQNTERLRSLHQYFHNEELSRKPMNKISSGPPEAVTLSTVEID